MKKNKMMRLASAMMVMTLMTTSVISGTFAKYVTSDEASDTARVAKWGVTVSVSGSLFGEHYYSKDIATVGNEISATITNSVDVDSTLAGVKNIVAPGTKSAKGLVLRVTGTPEVAYKVEMYSDNDVNSNIWLKEGLYYLLVDASTSVNNENVGSYYVKTAGGYEKATAPYDDTTMYYELSEVLNVTATEDGKYYPLTWYVDGAKVRTVEAVVSALKTKFVKNSDYAAGTDATNSSVVKWEWIFEGIGQDDAGDTILGNLMANGIQYVVVKEKSAGVYESLVEKTDYCLNVGLDATITVTQLD